MVSAAYPVSILPGLALAAALSLGSAPLVASSLQIQNVGNGTLFGARVDVENDCDIPNHVTVADPVAGGDFAACSSLSSGANLASGATTFTAGNSVALNEGFKVTGGTFTVEIDRTLYPDAWVQDDTPDGEVVYAASFRVNATNLVLEGVEKFFHFLAFDDQGHPELRLGVKRNGVERRLFLEVFIDNGGLVTTEGSSELVLPGDSLWHEIDVFWQKSTGAGANNGAAYLCVDQVSPPAGCVTLITLDNDTGAIDFVRWGGVDVPPGSDIGYMDLDDFLSGPFMDNFESGNTDAWSETAAAQVTCNVPVPYSTVRAAVADPGCNVIMIAAGSYLGSVNVNRPLTLQGAGSGATVIRGALHARGSNTRLTLSSLSINTIGAPGGCYPAALKVTDGAEVYPEDLFVSNAANVPTGNCVFSDSYEPVN